MRYLWLAVALMFLGVQTDTPADGREGEAPVDAVLFELPVGEVGERLVVARGPDRDLPILKSLRAALPDLAENFYEVRAELRSPGAEPVQLAARLRVEDGTKVDKGSVVLDARVEDANIVLAMAEGPHLFVWQIGIGQALTCWTILRVDEPWARSAAAYRLDDKFVAMKLGRTKDRRLTLAVTEKLSGQRTHYEEMENTPLQFKMTWQGGEKARPE